MAKAIQRIYYCLFSDSTWELTMDMDRLKLAALSRTATLQDLNDYGCVGLFVMDVIVHVDDGFFEWKSDAEDDGFGCKYGEYDLVENIKDRLLDRLEYLDMQDSEIYEEIISWKNYKVHSFLNLSDYSDLLG